LSQILFFRRELTLSIRDGERVLHARSGGVDGARSVDLTECHCGEAPRSGSLHACDASERLDQFGHALPF
jgi:hypothetical protein